MIIVRTIKLKATEKEAFELLRKQYVLAKTWDEKENIIIEHDELISRIVGPENSTHAFFQGNKIIIRDGDD